MLAALGARHPHDGRLDWLVPALLLAGEGLFLAALGLSRHVAPWLVFALLAAVVMRHVDLAFRARAGRASRPTCSASAGRGGCCWPAWPPWPHHAIRLRRAFGLSLVAFHLGFPQRMAGTRRAVPAELADAGPADMDGDDG